MPYSITQLARLGGLSRSTLLYYDRIGLLKPEKRARGSYRVYTENQRRKLETIRQLRATGIVLREIAAILERNETVRSNILLARLESINREITGLRNQQKVIVGLLANRKLLDKTKTLTKERWIAMLAAAGLDAEGMDRWHREFETTAPQAHQDFLESLGLTAAEIDRIRQSSRP